MSINMKTLTQALAKTAAVIEKTVQTTVQEVTGPRALQDYDLLDQVGSGGPGLAWKLFSARPKAKPSQAQYPLVCIWLLDKKALSEARTRAGFSKTAEDAFLDIVRADAARLVRLRHPGVVHVVQALDESKTAMAMVTEPLFASVANVLGNFDNIAKVPTELKGLEMGHLEIKHGLLQAAESLEFLHTHAKLIHRAISPEAVFITSSGAWKLGGFGFAIPADQNSGDSTTIQSFHYAEYDIEDSVLPLQPSLNYSAPELVRNKDTQIGRAADIFSLGCVAYHLLAHKPLLDCNNNVKMYMNRLTYLSHDVFSSIPPDLVGDLQRMLAVDSLSRLTALDFTVSPFFRDDTRLRALRFLDHMLERDNMQKSEFLKALSEMWKDFDIRVLRYKVLPPLCAELRNMVMQPMILPMVLTIAESQDRNEFELSTLPALTPVLASAAGETLLLLVKHAELIINKATHERLLSDVLPLLVRAYDDADVRIQEEVLRRTVCLAKQLDGQLVKQAILPRVHGLALKTTVAAVRVNALLCLGDLVSSLDKPTALDILQTLQRCTAVDRSVPTLMCTLGVANSMYKQYGVEFAAEHVLPLLVPLLIAQQLNVQQFGKFMLFVKDILRKIEEKRGVTVSDSGAADVSVKHTGVNGHLPEAVQKPSGQLSSSTKSTGSWDEDWGSMLKKSTSSYRAQESNLPLKSAATTRPTPVSNSQFQLTSAPDPHVPLSCPAVDIEWPPLAPSIDQSSQVVENDKQKSTPQLPEDSGFNEIDPFADWPPRPTNTANNSLGSMINNSTGMPNQGRPSTGASLGSTINNSMGISMQNQGRPAPIANPASLPLNNSIGLSKLYEQTLSSTINTASSSSFPINSSVGRGTSTIQTARKEVDLGMVFPSAKSEQPPPLRIAPPPPAGKSGGGRGRQQGRTDSASLYSLKNPKAKSEQPPLLDLL